MKITRSFAAIVGVMAATLSFAGSATHASTSRVATGVSGVEGDASITLQWTKPALPPLPAADAANHEILGYLVTVTDSATSTTLGTRACTHATGTAQSCIITEYTKADRTKASLVNGTSYTFTVVTQWINNLAAEQVDSDPSAASSALRPYTTPAAPTNVAASATGDEATVTFSSPASNGGSTITDYEVITYNSAGTAEITDASLCDDSVIGATTSRKICGLTNNTGYTFKVKASNSRGVSPASDISSVLTIAPGSPAQPTATIDATGDTSNVTVTWTAVTGTGTITEYEVMPYKGSEAQTSLKMTWSEGTLSKTVSGTGLDLGSAYTFKVRAKNSTGFGTYSAASGSVTASTKPSTPSAPTAVDAESGSTATVSWTATTANGSAVTSYTASAYTASGDTEAGTPCTLTDLSSLSCNVSGLTAGTAYYFKVKATNSRGDSALSGKSSNLTLATASSTTTTSTTVPGGGSTTTTLARGGGTTTTTTTTTTSTTTTVPTTTTTTTTSTTTTTLPSLLKPSAGTPVSVRKPAAAVAQKAAAAVSKTKMTVALQAPVTSGKSAVVKYVFTFKTTSKGAKTITKTVAVKAGKTYTVAVTGKKGAKYQVTVTAMLKSGKKSTWTGPKITIK